MKAYSVFTGACIVFAIFFGILLMIGSKANSQEAPANCAETKALNDELQKQFGETVTAGGVLDGSAFMYITSNHKTHTFTVLVRRPDGKSCVVLGGKGFALADPATAKGSGM